LILHNKYLTFFIIIDNISLYCVIVEERVLSMGYKRALWHSGLTYQQTCEVCHTVVRYKDDKLGFRPWYADGFVYCTNCRTPLRHSERYAIDAETSQIAAPVVNNESVQTVQTPTDTNITFCSQCGKQFKPEDRFCSGCGSKRS
jgi:predicted amidophosphoribosyltransferase